MNQLEMETHIDQANNITTMKPKDISKERRRDRRSKLDQNQLDSLMTVICQSG